MRLALIALALACVLATDKSDHWAILVAGSKGFYNYRHQADICHAYHIMLNNGIPADQIIVMSYDDVATSSSNPYPGQLFNKPDGEDVRAGCVIDYDGADVTPENFLKILRNEDMGGKKTFKTNKNSKIFINYSDHGAKGLIAFPTKSLYAKDMMEAFTFMHENGLYDEMVVYIEACHSGSMFDGLLGDDMNIYATTAAHGGESSWAYYCSPNDVVGGKRIGTCLGDEYSITWMEDTESHDTCAESLEEQFNTVLTNVKKSHVQEYGDLTMKSEAIGNFEGVCDAAKKDNIVDFLLRKITRKPFKKQEGNPVDSRDVKMHYLYHKYLKSGDREDAMHLQAEITERHAVEARFEKLTQDARIPFASNPEIMNHDCYKATVESYVASCGYNEYDLKYYGHFVNLCNILPEEQSVELAGSMC
jgi:legumain